MAVVRTKYAYELPRAAGKSYETGAGTSMCMAGGLPGPETPPHVRKWRASQFNRDPGQRVVHPGQIDDAKAIDPMTRWGASKIKHSDHVPDLWKVQSGGTKLQEKLTESVYHSTKREPLGRSYVRGHVLPAKTAVNSFRFGVSSANSESVKTVVSPPAPSEEDLAAEALYKRSHGSYAPGEQRRRDYDWPMDPATCDFGVGGKGFMAFNGASPEIGAILRGEGEQPAQTITSKDLANFKALQDRLGRVRHLGFTASDHLSKGHVYGKASAARGKGEWDARACVEGDYSWAEQQPDPDLGAATRPGFRNCATRPLAFGVPSIRSDIPRQMRRSVADRQNYGDEADARALLNPSQFSGLGVEDDDFFAPRSKAELLALFATAGATHDGAVLDAVWTSASAASGGAAANLLQFQAALNDYEEAVALGRLKQWWRQQGRAD
ncbi:unnamed protein product [Phaeothamnion confervicola]